MSQTTRTISTPSEHDARSYSRKWPVTFNKAKGSFVYGGKDRYVDFYSAGGSLNYGHNDPDAQRALMEYVSRDGILHAMDAQADAYQEFLRVLDVRVMQPRELCGYRVLFAGQTGADAMDVALKCARLATGRTEVVSFLRGFNGVTLGGLAARANAEKKDSAGVPVHDSSNPPFDAKPLDDEESLRWFERVHLAGRSGKQLPAAVLVELVQSERGVNVARDAWTRGIADVCARYAVPLIVDEIQSGCGRTGKFFAFEHYEIRPDIIPVSKSLSGLGLPLAIVLVKNTLDLADSPERTNVIGGNNASFITATSCINKFWSDSSLENQVERKSALLIEALEKEGVSDLYPVRGLGLIHGVDLQSSEKASEVARRCFSDGVLLETSGPQNRFIRLLPPLTMEDDDLVDGARRIARAIMTD